MSKEMIISVNGREKKIAIIEDDVVTEFYVERGDENQGIVGNIYKGRVMKVLPGMQSAFVDIGLERDSFLYVSDFFDEDLDEDEEEVRKEIVRPQPIQAPIQKIELGNRSVPGSWPDGVACRVRPSQPITAHITTNQMAHSRGLFTAAHPPSLSVRTVPRRPPATRPA